MELSCSFVLRNYYCFMVQLEALFLFPKKWKVSDLAYQSVLVPTL